MKYKFYPWQSSPRGRHRLTEADARRILQLAASGKTAPQISLLYPSIGIETIRKVIRRETWKWVTDTPTALTNDAADDEHFLADAHARALQALAQNNPDDNTD